jgi:hypothetical protein
MMHRYVPDTEPPYGPVREFSNSMNGYYIQDVMKHSPPGAWVNPVVTNSDKTELAPVGNQSAHPLYVALLSMLLEFRCVTAFKLSASLGNCDDQCHSGRRKDGGIGHAAFLPQFVLSDADNKLKGAARMREALWHAAVGIVLKPLEGMAMT